MGIKNRAVVPRGARDGVSAITWGAPWVRAKSSRRAVVNYTRPYPIASRPSLRSLSARAPWAPPTSPQGSPLTS